MVRLRHDPTSTGVIRDILPQGAAILYLVFLATSDQRYVKEEDLLALAHYSDEDTAPFFDHGLDALRREVLLSKLRSPFGESLYSLRASRLEFHVYQFKPVLKLLANPDQRLLIADEVGLGKTIEAGIILTELRARFDLDRILVVVPSALRQKWHDELRARFEETFEILDSPRVAQFLDEYAKHGNAVRLRGIASIDILRRTDFLALLGEREVHFDLVIIDEAHNCRNPGTRSHELATVLSENADAMLLLTATPLHLGNEDLFHLMQILQPGEFDDFSTFEYRIRPNRFLNAASRAIASSRHTRAREILQELRPPAFDSRYARNPYLEELLALIGKDTLTQESAVKCQRLLLDLNGLAHVFTRTRKREVSTDAPMREARVLKYRYSSDEAVLYEGVSRLVRSEWRRSGQSEPIGFRLVTRERQAASCLPAFAAKYLTGEVSGTLDAEEVDLMSSLGLDVSTSEERRAWQIPASLRSLAQRLNEGSLVDTKFAQFHAALQLIIREEPRAKVMVFSFFLDTLKYLGRRLRTLGLDVLVIDGSVRIEHRLSIIDAFRQRDGPVILLSSEVGSEGLDFQFCHIMFNYDLPWNPMKVEQRIGRIDRFGQKSRVVWVYSLVAEDTIEDRVLLRLYQRIRVFEETVGDLETILGEEMARVTSALFTKDLTKDQQVALSERVAGSILRRKQELEEFEEHKMEFLGQDAIFESDINTALSTGRYVAPSEVRSLVASFISAISDAARLEQNRGDESYVLTPDHKLAEYLKSRMGGAEFADEVSRIFRRKLHSIAGIPLTFTDTLAYDRKLLEYVHLSHPVCRIASDYWQSVERGEYPLVSATVETNEVKPGDYYMFLFGLRIDALRSQERLVPVTLDANTLRVSKDLNERFLNLLQSANGRTQVLADAFPAGNVREAKRIALQEIASLMEETEQEQERRNTGLVEMRLASLRQSYESKDRLYRRYFETATEPRIRRMRRGQIDNLEARYRADIERVESRRAVSVSFSIKLAAFLSLRADDPDHAGGSESVIVPAGSRSAESFRPGKASVYDKKCPHGVALSQVCGICNPEEFKRMTGID